MCNKCVDGYVITSLGVCVLNSCLNSVSGICNNCMYGFNLTNGLCVPNYCKIWNLQTG